MIRSTGTANVVRPNPETVEEKARRVLASMWGDRLLDAPGETPVHELVPESQGAWDSLTAVEVALQLEQQLGLREILIGDESTARRLSSGATLADLISLVVEHL